jgi:glycerophosphoryl diester phosphodiesterase
VSRPLVIAHRGASGYEVENSLAAFHAAGERGADAVELDIHSTADGAFVVHHGDRVAGHLIPQSSFKDVRAHPLPNGEPIPTLEEALAVIVPRMIAFVEVKTLRPQLDEKFFQVIEKSGAPGRVALHGFDHRVIRRLGERRPHIRRGVLMASYPVDPLRCLQDADAQMLWQHRDHVDEALVAAVHGARMAIHVYTVNDPEELRHLAAIGVDGLCTDFPDAARTAIASLPA